MMRVIGYGNPGRGDDGLGPAFAEQLAAVQRPDILVTTDFQLTVDHALLITDTDRVVFVDALIGSDVAFTFERVAPSTACDVTSHSLRPEGVLALCNTLYGHVPEAYLLGISGNDFGEVKEGLSPLAQSNLSLAKALFYDWLGSTDATHSAQGLTHA